MSAPPYPSLHAAHRAGACPVECRYCKAALAPHQVTLIAPNRYAAYVKACKQAGKRSLFQ